jgi:ABC-2 type transport system ATP-binding protein
MNDKTNNKTTEYALEINEVSKSYSDFKALSNISFKVEKGDFIGLLGVNGAGKTTLINSIAGINKFDGQIKIMGYDVKTQVVLAKSSIGVVPQEIAFDPFLTVYQTLELHSGLYGVKGNNHKWIMEVLERLHLQDKVNSNTRSLSGGMKRRLMVAQAIIHKPPVIILDEPTAGVDVELRKSLWEFISDLHKNQHTILLTSHYLEEVELLCKNIIMINKGKVIHQSSKESLLHDAAKLGVFLHIDMLDSNKSEICEELKEFLVSNNYMQGECVFRLKDYNEALSVLSRLKQHNFKVNRFELKHPSLEDIFINYVTDKNTDKSNDNSINKKY